MKLKYVPLLKESWDLYKPHGIAFSCRICLSFARYKEVIGVEKKIAIAAQIGIQFKVEYTLHQFAQFCLTLCQLILYDDPSSYQDQ